MPPTLSSPTRPFIRPRQAEGIGAQRVGSAGIATDGARQSRHIVAHWAILSAFLIVLGLVVHFAGFKMNKQLWSPSFLFFMVRVFFFAPRPPRARAQALTHSVHVRMYLSSFICPIARRTPTLRIFVCLQ
jgi:hypothetical protein